MWFRFANAKNKSLQDLEAEGELLAQDAFERIRKRKIDAAIEEQVRECKKIHQDDIASSQREVKLRRLNATYF